MGADSWVIYVRYIMVYPIWDDVLDDSQALKKMGWMMNSERDESDQTSPWFSHYIPGNPLWFIIFTWNLPIPNFQYLPISSKIHAIMFNHVQSKLPKNGKIMVGFQFQEVQWLKLPRINLPRGRRWPLPRIPARRWPFGLRPSGRTSRWIPRTSQVRSRNVRKSYRRL